MSVPLSVGQLESIRRVLDQGDFDRFAALSGDDNPIHTDPGFSARTRFGRTVAHGMLLYSTVCSVLGSRMPGPGTVQLEQELMFPSPTYAGEEITIQLEVTDVQPDKGLADLTTTVVRPDGNVGLQGRTLIHLPGATLLSHTFSPSPTLPPPPTSSHSSTSTSSFKGLEIGQQAEISRAFTAQDLAEYAALTGDVNPLFTDADYARRLGLVAPTVPGSLLGGLFSTLLGTQLPGQGTNYLKQRLEFPAPAYLDQELTAVVKITRIRPEKQLVNLGTLCTNPIGEVVCRGEALVLVSDVRREA